MTSWSDVIQSWFLDKSSIVSARQLVWAKTVRVGCGFANCDTYNVYVCNYAPGMNQLGTGNAYVIGRACEKCPNSCKDNLCDCGEKLCENLGTLNPATCTCQCVHPFYHSSSCSLSCNDVKESEHCNRSTPAKCSQEVNKEVHCPNLCHVCPYGGKGYKEGSVQLPNRHKDNNKNDKNKNDNTSGQDSVVQRSGQLTVLSVSFLLFAWNFVTP